MSNTTSPSPSINQPRSKGEKQAGGEAPNKAANLNLNEPVIDDDQGDASAKNKGKEIMMVEEQPPNPSNKRKAIVLGGPDDHHPHDDHFGSKNPRTFGATQEPSEQNSSPPSLQEAIGNDDKPKKNNAPSTYTCDFCDKSFGSPQALGGHQNAHKLERHLRYGVERGSSMEPPPPSQPILNPVNMDQLHNNNNNNPMMNNAMTMGNGNQHDVPIKGSFHEAGNNTAPYHPQWSVAGFGTGLIGAMEIGNYGGFHHPYQGPWLNHGYENGYNAGGFSSFGTLDPGHAAFYYPEGAWFNPGYETGYNIGGTGYYDPFQQPELAWMNHGGIGTGYYGGVDNTYGLHGQIDDEAYDPHQLQQSATPSGITEFVWLPIRDGDYHQNTGTQQVGVEIDDFGLVPKGDGDEDTESLQEEAIDLTLKL